MSRVGASWSLVAVFEIVHCKEVCCASNGFRWEESQSATL